MSIFKDFFSVNLPSHRLQAQGLIPECVWVCRFRLPFVENFESHKWQPKGFSPVCLLLWMTRLPLEANLWLHCSHWNGFVCCHLWLVRLADVRNVLWQCSHWYKVSIVPSGLVLETLCIDSSTDGGLFSIVGPAAACPPSSHTAWAHFPSPHCSRKAQAHTHSWMTSPNSMTPASSALASHQESVSPSPLTCSTKCSLLLPYFTLFKSESKNKSEHYPLNCLSNSGSWNSSPQPPS